MLTRRQRAIRPEHRVAGPLLGEQREEDQAVQWYRKAAHAGGRGRDGHVYARLAWSAGEEVWDDRFFYFVAKFEMNFIDTAKKAACLSTVQIDVENTDRFDINYVAEDGQKRHPLLMHTSVSGSLDRNVYAILEDQAMRMSRGEKAAWPVWMAPIQVRLVPVTDDHLEGALRLAEEIPFRVDVDDRDVKLGKKIRDAEKEWVPYTLVVGEKELSGGTLTVRPAPGRAGGDAGRLLYREAGG